MQSINHISADRVNIFPVLRVNQITCTAVNYQLKQVLFRINYRR